MEDSTTTALVWMGVAVAFFGGEIFVAGSFFLAPFAVGALAACLASILGASLALGMGVFVVVSLLAFLTLRPLSKKLDEQSIESDKIGANRLLYLTGVVTKPIGPGGETGSIKIEGEDWTAESSEGQTLAVGTAVTVTEVVGTKLLVSPDV